MFQNWSVKIYLCVTFLKHLDLNVQNMNIYISFVVKYNCGFL